ncbi:MAG: helix-hairpin-helix domain-containing protein [Gemmatimonadales bacterium]|nr:helix-hairpin-helix domain-containing protein [Gemmatimonadales bacterium]
MGFSSVGRPRALLSRRQALGIVLACLVLMTGRGIRQILLIGPEDRWRDSLWLDDWVLAPEKQDTASKEARPVLTTPLPINFCSTDSLTLLPGVGPVLAGRIDEIRRRGVVFQSVADLQEVKGIGPALSARLESLVVFFEPIPPSGGKVEEISTLRSSVRDPVPAP